MSQAERLWRDLDTGHSALMDVPLSVDIQDAVDTMREWGRSHGRELSIVRMVTDEDQKLAIGPGTQVTAPSS